MWSFYKAFFKNPRSIGAVIPSSKHLARAVAKFIPVEQKGLVVELGPGTGAITRAILQRGIAHHQLIAIEASADLVNFLRKKFPKIQIIHGNADRLSQLLMPQSTPVKAVISSIPLRVLSLETRKHIINEIEKILMPGGYYIQYTYWNTTCTIEPYSHFKKVNSVRVLLNVPFARVNVFRLE